jgi:hypothetical protein
MAALEGVKDAVVGESPVAQQEVSVGMPLNQVSGGSDGDDDSGPAVWAESFPDVLGDGLGDALRKVEEELPPLPEDPPTTCRAKRAGQTRSSSSRCCSTSRKSGDSRGRRSL